MLLVMLRLDATLTLLALAVIPPMALIVRRYSRPMTERSYEQQAAEGELYETNQMYPEFARVARAERDAGAEAEFVEQGAESAEHARIFREALAKAERRFTGLAKVEARHAARYAAALERRSAPGKR